MNQIRNRIASFLHPHGKVSFLRSLGRHPNILDVGCGNDAVVRIKRISPDCHYTGIDTADYNLSETAKLLMENYVKVPADHFAAGIKSLTRSFDGVISSHNLEHCDDRNATLSAMMAVVSTGGRIFLSFPCEESVHFPSREGTLNYYDDSTHKGNPPSFLDVISNLEGNGFTVDFARRRYRPLLMRGIGFLTEPLSRVRGRLMTGTWALYGFETIVVATKVGRATDCREQA